MRSLPWQSSPNILAPINVKLGIAGKVCADFEEERAKIFIDGVEIAVASRGVRDPRICSTGLQIAVFLGRETSIFSSALPMTTIPLHFSKCDRFSWTISPRLPLTNLIKGICLPLITSLTAAMKVLFMVFIRAEKAKISLRWNRKSEVTLWLV